MRAASQNRSEVFKILAVPTFILAALAITLPLVAQQVIDWAREVRGLVKGGQLEQAQGRTEQWISAYPQDLDAKAWHARILNWRGHRQESEAEFRALLKITGSDPDLLIELARLLNFRSEHAEALELLNRACAQPPQRPDCRLEQARTLVWMGWIPEAKAIYRSLALEPSVSRESRAAVAEMAEQARHELRVGGEADLLSYTQDGSVISASLASRWNPRWRTSTTVTEYHRFGQGALGAEASATCRVPGVGSFTIGGGSAGNSGIAPKATAQFGYEQGFRVSAGPMRAMEALYDQKWTWYPGARILSFSPGVFIQLPKRSDWLLRLTATRINLRGPSEWTPSFQTRFSFPLHRRLKAYVLYASGTENFGTVDQIIFRSSRVAGGGVVMHTAEGQEFRVILQRQTIAGGRTQNSFGGTYGIRF